jgi:hypothetical protein
MALNENFKLILYMDNNHIFPSYLYSSCNIINRDILLLTQMKDYMLDLIQETPIEIFNSFMNSPNNNISAYYVKKLYIFFTIVYCILFEYDYLGSKIIKIPINYTEFNHPIINLCLGTPKQCLPFKISLNTNFSYVIDYNIFGIGFEKEKSETYIHSGSIIQLKDKKYNLEGYESFDILQIENNELKKGYFKFFIINKGFKYTNYCGVIGFKNSSYNSFVNFIKLYGNLNEKYALEIKTYNKGKNGLITFGINNFNDYNKITKINENNPFEINLNEIILFNNLNDYSTIINLNEKVMISPEHNKIFCPENFLIFLVRNFFTKFNKSGVNACSVKEEKGVYKYLLCNSFLLNESSMYIYFIFGKWNIKFSFNVLFTKINEKTLIFNIMTIINENKWIFGNLFFRYYDMVYDISSSTLRFKMNKN